MQRNPTQFVKMCPKCNKEQYYKNIGSLLHALRKNTQCKKCLHSDKLYLEKLRKSNVGLKRSTEVKQHMYAAFDRNRGTGIYANIGKDNPMFGITGSLNPSYKRKHTDEELVKMRQPRSEEFKLKMRLVALNRRCPNYNKFSCEVFDLINKNLNWNGIYATIDKEYSVLGYSIDYYEPIKNIIIEWDEEQHYINGNLRHRDSKRQETIINYLHCKFIRIRQRDIFEKLNIRKVNKNHIKEIANKAFDIIKYQLIT